MRQDQTYYKKDYAPFLGGYDETEIGYSQSYMEAKRANQIRKDKDEKRNEKKPQTKR